MSVDGAAQVGRGLFAELLLDYLAVLGGAGHVDFLFRVSLGVFFRASSRASLAPTRTAQYL
ncbi:hypothetical protein EMIT0P44_350054 [Pseudomonas sp. IT-P44]